MRGRAVRYYLIVTAIAALLSVVQGIDVSFGNGNDDAYCDYEVTAELANFEYSGKPCRLRVWRVFSVFGRIYLVLLACMWVPAGLYLWARSKVRNHWYFHEVRTALAPRLAPWTGTGIVHQSGGFFRQVALKIYRRAKPFSVGYLSVSAICVFAYLTLPAWVVLTHNSMASYCHYDQENWQGNFYAYGDPCDIFYVAWLHYYLGGTIVFTAILQIPLMLLGAYCCAYRWHRFLEDKTS
ncbi:MAG: hypothetical protein O7G83_12615 [Proteobacteria bacterium]|nr:hypothetical protein [Pseudomonadota bacterium]